MVYWRDGVLVGTPQFGAELGALAAYLTRARRALCGRGSSRLLEKRGRGVEATVRVVVMGLMVARVRERRWRTTRRIGPRGHLLATANVVIVVAVADGSGVVCRKKFDH